VDPTPLPMSYALVFDPKIETAVWLIFAAVGCALVLLLSDMVKKVKNRDRPTPRN
jgi:hypothetical protein